MGTQILPNLARHAGDRNRTSPFAFTGNKFEFRAVGSSQSSSFAITVLNTIATDAISTLTSDIESLMNNGESFSHALATVLKQTIKNHKRIIFNGDGYSDDWKQEASQRGLLNLPDTISALPLLSSEKNCVLFKKYAVLSNREIAAREEVMFDHYFKTINIEGETTEWIAQTMILPAALMIVKEQSTIAKNVKELGLEFSSVLSGIHETIALTNNLSEKLAVLNKANKELGGETIHEKAHHMHDTVIPAMNQVRQAADALERIMPDALRTMPNYREMLFVK